MAKTSIELNKTTERPILFSSPMVKAILEGRKTQTRRVVKIQPEPVGDNWKWAVKGKAFCHNTSANQLADFMRGYSPYGKPGAANLWVREAWRAYEPHTVVGGKGWMSGVPMRVYANPAIEGESIIEYRADKDLGKNFQTWLSPIHMPRWASRITLAIESIRVERLQDISEADARAEGVELTDDITGCADDYNGSYRKAFSYLWDKINKGRGFGWNANPWVWCLTFRRLSA
jgi:hypothetical protein